MQTFLEDHDCSKIDKCIHCQQNHKCNSLKFPVVKSFRAELTKKLLNFNHHPAIMMKLNDLIGKISEVKDHLANLALKNDESVKESIDVLSKNAFGLKKDVVQQNILIERHGNMFSKQIIISYV